MISPQLIGRTGVMTHTGPNVQPSPDVQYWLPPWVQGGSMDVQKGLYVQNSPSVHGYPPVQPQPAVHVPPHVHASPYVQPSPIVHDGPNVQ